MMHRPLPATTRPRTARIWAGVGMAIFATTALAQDAGLPGTRSLPTRFGFETLVARTEAAIETHKMGLVAKASASQGAAGRGIKVPGNAVLMVFRNDYAVRMLDASVAAGIEAPQRLSDREDQRSQRIRCDRSREVACLPAARRRADGERADPGQRRHQVPDTVDLVARRAVCRAVRRRQRCARPAAVLPAMAGRAAGPAERHGRCTREQAGVSVDRPSRITGLSSLLPVCCRPPALLSNQNPGLSE